MPTTQSQCKDSGVVLPVIDRNRCEGKEDCVQVCPFQVLEMGTLGPAEQATLTRVGRMKAFFHGYRQVFVTNPESCHACGLCVTACPERAIKLISAQRAG